MTKKFVITRSIYIIIRLEIVGYKLVFLNEILSLRDGYYNKYKKYLV